MTNPQGIYHPVREGDFHGGEKIELRAGLSPDVTVTRLTLHRDSSSIQVEVELSSAGAQEALLEVKVPTFSSWRIAEADAAWVKRDGIPVFTVRMPANDSKIVCYTVTRE